MWPFLPCNAEGFADVAHDVAGECLAGLLATWRQGRSYFPRTPFRRCVLHGPLWSPVNAGGSGWPLHGRGWSGGRSLPSTPPLFDQDLARTEYFHWFPPPAGTEAAGKGVTFFRYGKGQAVYLGVELFRAFRSAQSHRMQKWIHGVLRQLVPSPALRLEAGNLDNFVHATFFRSPRQPRILVQVVNASAKVLQGEVVPARGAKIVTKARKISLTGGRVLWPEQRKLEVQRRGDEWEILVPQFDVYTIVGLETA